MERQVVGAAVGAVVSSFLRPLADEAARLAKEEIALLWGVDEEIEKLSGTLKSIRSVLSCAEQREPGDDRVRDWLERLRDVAHDADDVLDEFSTAAAVRSTLAAPQPTRRRGGGRERSRCSLSSCFTCIRTAPYRHEIGWRIKEIREKLEEIDNDHKKLGLLNLGGTSSSATDATVDVRETTSMVDDEYDFVGREKEKEEIIKKLLGYLSADTEEPQTSSAGGNNSVDGGARVPLVPILGMGGIGKTALAQAVFNDRRVRESFTFTKWIYVGEKFDAKRILTLAMDSNDSAASTLVDLQICLLHQLRQQRFLIVLDDVWSEKYEEWQQILPPLMKGGREAGGAVVFTTRSHKVAIAARAGTPDPPLAGLPEEDCWRIFEKHAFRGRASSGKQYPGLRRIGRDIVKKLNGVPLAARAVAGFLRETLEEDRWRSVLVSIAWPLTYDILPVLRLSYQHLPPPLKQCFAYCSVFPKGFVFDKPKLVQMWIAHSYVQPQVGVRLEDKAGIYFDDLHLRSFLQRDRNGDGYQMHDLMHDLARWVSSQQSLRLTSTGDDEGSSGIDPNNKVFHVSFSNGPGPIQFQELSKSTQRARTRLYLHEDSYATFGEFPRNVFDRHLRCIRVLCLSYCDMEELPESVGELKHLRYLDLSFTKIGILPESLCGLWNLQTLRILNSDETMLLVELPSSMSKLVNLRHLDVHEDLAASIRGMGRLTSLQELKVFRVRKEDGHTITEMKDLAQLGGGLCIKDLENVNSGAEAGLVNLKNKLYLDELGLEWDTGSDPNLRNNDVEMEVLEGLQPPPNLKSLRVSNNGGLRHPTWMKAQLLSNLESISIHGCRNWLSLPPLGGLPYLKALVLGGTDRVKQVGHEFYGDAMGEKALVFTALEELEIYDMAEWEEWMGAAATAGETTLLFPALRRLQLMNCPRLKGMPGLPPSLVELKLQEVGLKTLPEISRCTDLQGNPRASSLSKLDIQLCPSLESIPCGLLQSLTSLVELEIRDCRELASMGFQYSLDLRRLKDLAIVGCPKLTLEEKEKEEEEEESCPSTPSTLLPSLELLTTDNDSVLRQLLQQDHTSLHNLTIRDSSYVPGDLRCLPSLSILTIMNCPQVQSLPELQHHSRLGRLWVDGCPQLQSLPLLRGLSQLTKLCVENCPQLQSLPEGELPATMKQLWIKGCPRLKERCHRENGEDWPKIAHVPSKFIL